MANDPFAVLGVSSSATEDEIKAAYRKLAKKYHPDLNPGDKAAEQKMREVNEAYTQALQIKKNGGRAPENNPYSSPYGSWGQGGPYGNSGSYGNGSYGNGSYGSWGGYGSQGSSSGGQGGYGGNPFGDFFGAGSPFSSFFGGEPEPGTGFRQRSYSRPELETVQAHVLARRYQEALSLLNRIPQHDADWHALYARADLGLGNRVSALDHARTAARMAPQDAEYQNLLSTIESGRQTYRQTQSGGYDYRSVLCGNPCLTCLGINMLLNCCLGGCGRYGMWC